MPSPDLILNTPTARVDVFKPVYDAGRFLFPASFCVYGTDVTVELSSRTAELLAAAISTPPAEYQRRAYEIKADLSELLQTKKIPDDVRASLTSILLDLRALADGSV